ncbi:hypothetical protein P12x_005256 [Tundrisphaera lichenicola]|uniref:hypothetical protein n=1 Tax=Tundrisphaera lichenicola TaxID=2029860 RepID=UPI003EBBF3EE
MTAKTQNITIEQGADFDEPFYVTDSSGSVVDISGASAALQIRPAVGDASLLITLTTAEGGGLTIDGATGKITPFISEDTTTDMAPGLYVYDLKMLTAEGYTRRTHQGNALVSAEITTIEIPVNPASTVGAEDGGSILLEDGSQILTED